MALRDPVAIYNAATNLEAQMIRLALESAGIEAFAAEDVSNVGLWMFGTIPEIHKPQIWVDRDDVPRAGPVLAEFERQAVARRAKATSADTITVVCEECGKTCEFPAERRGAVEECPHCRGYVDVEDGNAGEASDAETV